MSFVDQDHKVLKASKGEWVNRVYQVYKVSMACLTVEQLVKKVMLVGVDRKDNQAYLDHAVRRVSMAKMEIVFIVLVSSFIHFANLSHH